MPDCEKCTEGNRCAEGCAYWFLQELKENKWHGIFIDEKGDKEVF